MTSEQINSFKDGLAQLMQEEIIGKWINKLAHASSGISFSARKTLAMNHRKTETWMHMTK